MKTSFFSFAKMFSLAAVLLLANALTAQTAADEKNILGLTDKWMEISKLGDANAMTELYADKATAIFFDGTVVNGKEALRETFKVFMANPNPDDTMELDEKSVRFLDADHAVLTYRMHGTTNMGGQKMDWKGVGTAVLVRKGANWLIELNQDTPIMQMPGQ